MLQSFLYRSTWFAALLMLQTLIFNHIHLWGYATPMPYIFILLVLPNTTAKWIYLSVAFAMGLCIDVVSNTFGAAAAALTLTGLFTPAIVRAFAPDEKAEDVFTPSVNTMQWSGFLKLCTALTFIHVCTFYLLETFSFAHLEVPGLNIAGSIPLTIIFLATFERIRSA